MSIQRIDTVITLEITTTKKTLQQQSNTVRQFAGNCVYFQQISSISRSAIHPGFRFRKQLAANVEDCTVHSTTN